MDSKSNFTGGGCRPALACSPFIADHYEWQKSNRPSKFETWEDMISHAKSKGYDLVPSGYHIPHWAVKMRTSEALPKIYVMRPKGNIDELKASFDRPASEIGYPIFFKANAGLSGGGYNSENSHD